ncbi:Signal transduction response regulator, receiver domain [Sesbania bispinosa]|nr:Signal transduction response regulator, receiver domain [Sesbania bispinosa]
MHLCASLIKQMEATQQSERKNMNKSLAFASASHDLRTSLAGLTGLIELSYKLVKAGSRLETNLKQMEDCTHDLLGLLNSILDTSKIESGKMQLEEEEFDVSYLLEGVVDFYHPEAMKKGVDLVLDPCNGSVIKYSRVKGDRGKLKQVLCNLLNNAVKFTSEGNITVRAWAQKPTLQSSIIKTNQYSFMKCLSCLLYKKNEAHDDLEKAMNSIQQDPNSMDFIFEVDDTGKGIPKENYKSVFENYVQVKESALGQGGTGLGLGIVQSLVRLMHGDIGIVDKDIGKKGTCFRFNVLLTLCESETVTECSTRECLDYGSGDDRNQTQGRVNIHTTSSGSSICSMSPRLHICSSSPRPEASHVVLLIGNKERRRTSQRFMESLGIKVKAVKSWKHLFYTLEKFRLKGHYSGSHSSSESSNMSSHNYSFAKARGVPLSAMDGNGIEYIPPSVLKKTDIGAAPGLYPNSRKALPTLSPKMILDRSQVSPSDETPCGGDSSCHKPLRGKKFLVVEDSQILRRIALAKLIQLGAIVEQCENGKQAVQLVDKGLIRDYPNPPYDYILMDCKSAGLPAFLNPKWLEGQPIRKASRPGRTKDREGQPTWKMPEMDGFEATRRIREIEKAHKNGVRIPIIALTADEMMTVTAMDFHIVKPIDTEKLLRAIKCIHTERI